jgi:hypothetical protein
MQRGGAARLVRHAHRSAEHLASKTFAVIVECGQGHKLTDLAPLRGSDIYGVDIVNSAAAGESYARPRFRAVAR